MELFRKMPNLSSDMRAGRTRTGSTIKKLLVWGQAEHGEYLQVVFLIQDDGALFVIHARPLTRRERNTGITGEVHDDQEKGAQSYAA